MTAREAVVQGLDTLPPRHYGEAMKVTIDRNKWLRGEGGANSYLLRSGPRVYITHGKNGDGKMCCLGFVLRAMGRTDEELAGVKTPLSISFNVENQGRLRVGQGTRLLVKDQFSNCDTHAPQVATAIRVNDDQLIDPDVRERELTAALGELGIELEFVDGEVQP